MKPDLFEDKSKDEQAALDSLLHGCVSCAMVCGVIVVAMIALMCGTAYLLMR